MFRGRTHCALLAVLEAGYFTRVISVFANLEATSQKVWSAFLFLGGKFCGGFSALGLVCSNSKLWELGSQIG